MAWTALAAGQAPQPGKTDPGTAAEERTAFVFEPPSLVERPDIFYDLVAIRRAQLQIEDMRKKPGTKEPGLAQPGAGGTKPEDQSSSERFVSEALDQIRGHYLAEEWRLALDLSGRKLKEVERLKERYPASVKIAQALNLINHYRVQAEEKVIYEEAKEKFRALGLKVEGILWAAEQPSLALIKGEPVARGVNERVKDCIISHIDTNRVDFMFIDRERRRRFDFQLYIGEDF